MSRAQARQILQSILSALLPPLATAAIVIIFVIFILLQRRDLRDRFISIIGSDGVPPDYEGPR